MRVTCGGRGGEYKFSHARGCVSLACKPATGCFPIITCYKLTLCTIIVCECYYKVENWLSICGREWGIDSLEIENPQIPGGCLGDGNRKNSTIN